MARETINTGSSANDGTGDTLRATGQKINSNFTELYTLVGGGAAGTSTLTDSGLDIIGASFRTKIGHVAPASEVSIDFPDSAGIVTVNTALQTLTNKTLTSPILNSPIITTPQIQDTSANHQYVLGVSELAADRTITLPLLTGADEFTFNGHTQTLTNKTLTTPVIDRPIVHGFLGDSVGNPIISTTATSYGKTTSRLRVQNSATGDVTLSSVGGQAHIGLVVNGKGNKPVKFSKYAANSQSIAAGATIGSGGTDITASIILITGNAGGTITLNDAVVGGTILHVIRQAGSGTQTITPGSFQAGTTVNFTAHKTATLIFDGTNWYMVGGTAVIA